MRHTEEIESAVKTEREAVASMIEGIKPMPDCQGQGAEHVEAVKAALATVAALVRARQTKHGGETPESV